MVIRGILGSQGERGVTGGNNLGRSGVAWVNMSDLGCPGLTCSNMGGNHVPHGVD